MKETATEQELTAEKVARSRKSVRGPGQEWRRDSTEH